MYYTTCTLRSVSLAVILVELRQLANPLTVYRQATHLLLPIMLAARDDEAWNGVRAHADFDPEPYLAELLVTPGIDWKELLPPDPEPLPF